jgi:hypothetical protein
MHHPLLDLMPTTAPEPEREEVSRSVETLQHLGWHPNGVKKAISIACDLAGETLSRHQSPLVICCDDETPPQVAVRLPVHGTAKYAIELSRQLREQLHGRELDRPGLSISFWSIDPESRSRHERHR